MDTVVAELVTFFQALKGGSLFVLALVLIGLALTVAAVAYQVIAIRRFQAASKATQENFETIAADLRKRVGDDASRALSPSRPVHCRMQEPYCAPTRDRRERL